MTTVTEVTPLDGLLFNATEKLKETPIESWERKERRIRATYGEHKADFIMQIERIYEDNYTDVACNKIGRIMELHISSMAERWSRSALRSGIRLYADDFESQFWSVIDDLISFTYSSGGEFWLYENIQKKMRSVALDNIRFAKRARRRHEYTAVSFERLRDDHGFECPDVSTSNIEEDYANREIVGKLLTDSRLTVRQQELLRYMYEEDREVSLQEIASALGLGHKETVRRLLQSIRKAFRTDEQR